VTCLSGNNCPDLNYNPDFQSYMDASKTIIVGTYGVSVTNPDAVLTVFTKMASSASYSQDDLTGVWQGNLLAAGPDAPWWQRITLTIKRDGTSTISSTQNNGKTKEYTGITWSISNNGVVKVPSGLASSSKMVMNSGKTVMVETGSWGDGSTEFAIFTKSASPPGPPTIGTAIPGNKEVTVSFTPPTSDGDSPITGYTATSSGGQKASGPATATSITVNGLKNGTPYTFTVTAENAAGTSLPSAASNPAVIPATKPGPPTGIKATAGNQQVTVSFTAPNSNGGSNITGYTVLWNPPEGSDPIAGSPLVTPHTIEGLKNGTVYTFEVEATNVMGTGLPSPSVKMTPATVPDAPAIGTVTAGKKQATVNFTPIPTSEDGGDSVTSYIVTAYIGTTVVKTKSGPKSPITVTGLTSGQPYTFTVAGKNAMGIGAESTSGSATPQ
jgi:hypothetical protein